MTDHELLKAVISATGLQDGEFAEAFAWRGKRALSDWRARKPIPETALRRLRWLHALPPARLARLVGLLTAP